MLGDLALHEQGGAFRIDPDRNQELREFDSVLTKNVWLLRQGQSVKIHNAVDGVVVFLHLRPIDECPEQISEMEITRWLDAAEHTFHGGEGYRLSSKGQRFVTVSKAQMMDV